MCAGMCLTQGKAMPDPLFTPHAERRSVSLVPLLSKLTLVITVAMGLGACQSKSSTELQELQQRIEQQNVKIQQLERKLNAINPQGAADSSGKPPAGPVKSLTFRSGTSDDRLRIYWADGTSSDLPCTKEQATLACG